MTDLRVEGAAPTADEDLVLDRLSEQFVRELFNDTAAHYDTVNWIFSLGSGSWYRRWCLRRAGLKPGQRLLDVATGTGLVAASARRLVGPAGEVIGLDVSEAMLAETRRKLDIPLIQGSADALPLGDATIDFVVMGYAIRHVVDLDACLREFHRVLRPGGTVLLLEVSSPRRPLYRTILARYFGGTLPVLSRWITRQPKVRTLMTYHWETMENCVAPEIIQDTMQRAGFTGLRYEGWFDLFRSYAGQRS
jgi:demethylmenaquinone methyltransferase/2-methoxy-6-polyprenyl-1,4-benzoquinol methylase